MWKSERKAQNKTEKNYQTEPIKDSREKLTRNSYPLDNNSISAVYINPLIASWYIFPELWTTLEEPYLFMFTANH